MRRYQLDDAKDAKEQQDTAWLLEGLNPMQREATTHAQGPLLILAGAGSGKTRVMTHRIAWLILEKGVQPYEIAALTFTNKAANEMRERVDHLLEDHPVDGWQITISTFHSFCARLLRRHGPEIGLSRDFTILDDVDQLALIRQVMEENDMGRDRAEAKTFRSRIEKFRNAALSPLQALEAARGPFEERYAQFFQLYENALARSNGVDFGSLIVKATELFRSEGRKPGFQYVMVDEFQDTNVAQYQLLLAMLHGHDNLAVVGDDDQAIYRWRGATVENILGFSDRHEKVKVVKLEQNYRSTQTILDAAHDVIQHNVARKPKKLWTENEGGEKLTLFCAQDDREEATYIVAEIARLLAEGTDPEEIAIFFRTNAQARAFEERLRFHGINYRIVGGMSFYAREEIKDILAYLRLALAPQSEVELMRVINKPSRKLGPSTIENLLVTARAAQVSMWDVVAANCGDEVAAPSSVRHAPGFLPGLAPNGPASHLVVDLKKAQANGLARFHKHITQTLENLETATSLVEVAQSLLNELDFHQWLLRQDAERAEDRWDNVGELLNAMAEFEAEYEDDLEELEAVYGHDSHLRTILRAFLDKSSLVDRSQEESGGCVTLMTVHGSKGLEFDTVFIAGLEEELFPSIRHDSEERFEEMAEERRLAYVAITRARRKLYMTYAKRRRVFGQIREGYPSRFLGDIHEDRWQIDPRSAYTRVGSSSPPAPQRKTHWEFDQSSPWDDEFSNESVTQTVAEPVRRRPAPEKGDHALIGKIVTHTKFGIGEVLNASGSAGEATLTITFPGHGKKKIKENWVRVLSS